MIGPDGTLHEIQGRASGAPAIQVWEASWRRLTDEDQPWQRALGRSRTVADLRQLRAANGPHLAAMSAAYPDAVHRAQERVEAAIRNLEGKDAALHG